MFIIDAAHIQSFDERRDIAIPGDLPTTIHFAACHWLQLATSAIEKKGRFCVALSGGSTPKAIFQKVTSRSYCPAIDWSKVWLFWSDERAVPPTDPQSNYHMAMSNGFSTVGIPPTQIFRMEAEREIPTKAREYEALLQKHLGKDLFDLVMLGVGEDGHTASLFPRTEALEAGERLVCANYIPEKKSWRMTLTLPCINQSQRAVVYALGPEKQNIIKQVLPATLPSPWPASHIGSKKAKALWILDDAAAMPLIQLKKSMTL